MSLLSFKKIPLKLRRYMVFYCSTNQGVFGKVDFRINLPCSNSLYCCIQLVARRQHTSVPSARCCHTIDLRAMFFENASLICMFFFRIRALLLFFLVNMWFTDSQHTQQTLTCSFWDEGTFYAKILRNLHLGQDSSNVMPLGWCIIRDSTVQMNKAYIGHPALKLCRPNPHRLQINPFIPDCTDFWGIL